MSDSNSDNSSNGLATALWIGGVAVLGCLMAAAMDKEEEPVKRVTVRPLNVQGSLRSHDFSAIDIALIESNRRLTTRRLKAKRSVEVLLRDYHSGQDLLAYLSGLDGPVNRCDSAKLRHIKTFVKSGRTIDPVTAARISDTLDSSWRREDADRLLRPCVA